MERFVVGVDGSASSEAALRWAATEALIRDATVTAVLAWNFLDQYHADGEHRFDPHYDEHTARRALDAVVERTLGDGADMVLRHVGCDLAATALLDASAEATMLVVGARGLGGFRGLVLGSVSQRCLEHAACPVAVVHGSASDDRTEQRVVVGVDGSDSAAAALGWALEEARLRAATLEVVHAWQVPYATELTVLGDTDLSMERAASEVLDDALVRAGLVPGEVERTIVQDTPVRALLGAAARADLIVVGSRGHGGFTGLLLGSVSHQLSRHADRPVVVVPHQRPGARR